MKLSPEERAARICDEIAARAEARVKELQEGLAVSAKLIVMYAGEANGARDCAKAIRAGAADPKGEP